MGPRQSQSWWLTLGLPSGKRSTMEKSPFFTGKSTISLGNGLSSTLGMIYPLIFVPSLIVKIYRVSRLALLLKQVWKGTGGS